MRCGFIYSAKTNYIKLKGDYYYGFRESNKHSGFN